MIVGAYITTVAEVRDADGWKLNAKGVFSNEVLVDSPPLLTHKPFVCQNYTVYSLLAGVRVREHGITPIAPGRNLPADADDDSLVELLGSWDTGNHWFEPDLETEMTVYDKQRNRAHCEQYGFSWVTAAELMAVDYDALITSIDEPTIVRSLRSQLGKSYFQHLELLSALGPPEDVRVLFGFTG
ncbi:hypothetical protein [Pseudomonas serbica]|uniref:hypothetical protein n=1 Tax=Pseudomonas serbica TaxID=2965074 RepID=UPI00237BB997|nr:hypothetical protein [Pseudomonas serbica]